MRLLWACVFLCGCGGSSASPDGGVDDEVPARDFTLVKCSPGEQMVGSACVASDFFNVVVPQASDWQPIDKDANGTSYVHATLLVGLTDAAAAGGVDVQGLFAGHGGQVVGAIPFANFYTVHFSGADTAAALDAKRAELEADKGVEWATRDVYVEGGLLSPMRPHDSDLETLTGTATYHDFYNLVGDMPIGADGTWAYQKINLFDAWDALYLKNHPLTPVVVGVLDGRIEQQDFRNLAFRGSHDLRVFGREVPPSGAVEHGTAVASILAAPNDGVGMNGMLTGLSCLHPDIAPIATVEDVSMVMLAMTNRGDALTLDALFYGIVYAVQAGARVVNISSGAGYYNDDLHDAATHIARSFRMVMGKASGTLFVLGAGNDDQDAGWFIPCAAARTDGEKTIDNVMCVAAVDEYDQKAMWENPKTGDYIGGSNHSSLPGAVTIAAPGSRILAQLPDGRLTMFSGSSAAAPMVSGAAGLLYAILPALDGSNAKKLLVSSAAGTDPTLGGHRLDAGAAVKKALRFADLLHPERAGTGQCRPPDTMPDMGMPPMCQIGTPCKFCFRSGTAGHGNPNPQDYTATGGSVEMTWDSETTLSEFIVTLTNTAASQVVTVGGSKADISTWNATGQRNQSLQIHLADANQVGTYHIPDQFGGYPIILKTADIQGSITGQDISVTFTASWPNNPNLMNDTATGTYMGTFCY